MLKIQINISYNNLPVSFFASFVLFCHTNKPFSLAFNRFHQLIDKSTTKYGFELHHLKASSLFKIYLITSIKIEVKTLTRSNKVM